MQLQISKSGLVNKFPVKDDISLITAPYLSFNNEYFLNLELSQEANSSNFKINNKFYKVNGSNVSPILNTWRYENPGVDDDKWNGYDEDYYGRREIDEIHNSNLSRTGTSITSSRSLYYPLWDDPIAESLLKKEFWIKFDISICGEGKEAFFPYFPSQEDINENTPEINYESTYAKSPDFCFTFHENVDSADNLFAIHFNKRTPNVANLYIKVLMNNGTEYSEELDRYVDEYFVVKQDISLSFNEIHSIKIHIKDDGTNGSGHGTNGVYEIYIDNDTVPYYKYTGSVWLADTSDFPKYPTMFIDGVAISNIVISNTKPDINEILPWTNTDKKNIKSIQSITKSVDYGTTFDNIGLPNAVVAALDDDTTVDLPVTWNTASYISTQAGSQNVTGTVVLTDNLTNTNNLIAVANVTVAEQVIEQPVNGDDWSLQFTLGTVESEVILSNIPGFSDKDTPSLEDFYGEDYDNVGRHLEIRYLGTQGNLIYAPDGIAVPNGCSSDEEVAAALNPDGIADYDPDAGNITFSSGSAGTKVYMLVYHSEPFNS